MNKNIGITLNNKPNPTDSRYSNGISQNIKFLADLMVNLGYHVFYLVYEHTDYENDYFPNQEVSFHCMEDIQRLNVKIDIVLEAGICLFEQDRQKLRLNSDNVKFITIIYGNAMIMDIQETFLRPQIKGIVHSPGADAVWISPHFEKSKSYLEAIYKAPVYVAPYIWEPENINSVFTTFDNQRIPDINVMEHNIDCMKTALIPLAVIEKLFQEAPNSFGIANIFNTQGFNKNDYFLQNIGKHLKSIYTDEKKVYFGDRVPFENAFVRPDILLCHQWECGLNYMYLEALYKGIPLVHNSKYIKDMGYYYPEFDANLAKEQFLTIQRNYNLEQALETNHTFLKKFSVSNPAIHKKYACLINDI
jgi:hypothetical protein